MSKANDECKSRFAELEQELVNFSASWHALELRLHDAEERFLVDRLASWQKWFALDEGELSNWTMGGLRWTAQQRVHKLLVLPLIERMTSRIGFSPTSWGEDGELPEPTRRSTNSVLDMLIDYWEARMKTAFDQAQKEDNNLMKKVRKTEKDERAAGVVALGMGDTKKVAALKRQRPAIWEATQTLLEKFAPLVKALTAFSVEELQEAPLGRMAGAVPGVVSRAICDWFFQKCLVDFDQLEKWWGSTKEGLQAKEKMWQSLVEKEGLLLRRIERGLDDCSNQRRRYSAYANFGGSETEVSTLIGMNDPSTELGVLTPKLEEPLRLLANAVSDMHKKLKLIRDSALWRVVDSAQEIHRQMSQSVEAEQAPWEAVRSEEAFAAVLEALGEPQLLEAQEGPGEEDGDASDAILAVMQRLERLAGAVQESREHFQEMAVPGMINAFTKLDTTGICTVLDGFVRDMSGLYEDLLEILDDPELGSMQAWLGHWEHLLGEASLPQRIEESMAALPLCRDSQLKPDERRQRRRWLALVRGLQLLVEDQGLRNQVAKPMLNASGAESPKAAEEGADAGGGLAGSEGVIFKAEPVDTQEELDVTTLAVPPSPVPQPEPGAKLFFSPPRRRVPWPQVAAEEEAPQAPPASLVQPTPPARAPPADRPETPSTSSTTHGEVSPMSKFVNGEFVTQRPGSGRGRRLKPLEGAPG